MLAYASLADLLTDVDQDIWADLPEPQRIAVDRVLLREQTADGVTDQRAVAAAFLSVVDRLSDHGPLLLAIDALQWLDPSSQHVLAFAARRLSGPVGLLATVRTEHDGSDSISWLQLPRPDAIHRIPVHPLASRELHTVVKDKLGHPIPTRGDGANPPALRRKSVLCHRIGARVDRKRRRGGARHVGGVGTGQNRQPRSTVHDVLLAAACLAVSTVELVGEATAADHGRLIELLEVAERHGIVSIEGNRIRFTHPLLAGGVYTDASPTERKLMHRRLAEVVVESELRARHLALASTTGDRETLEALDDAAASAQARGTPAAAAELLELAIALGGGGDDRARPR